MGEELLLHIRIGLYHFKISFRTFRVSRNDYHIGYPDGYFRCYQIFYKYLD